MQTQLKFLPANTALLVIDVQDAFFDSSWGQRNNPQAEENIARLLAFWRFARLPVFHIRHISLRPDSLFAETQPGSRIQTIVAPLPDEPVITKNVNSAFIGTSLEEQLRAKGIDHLVIAGLTTDHCVSTTTRMAGNLGFTTYVVADGTATHERVGPTGERYTAEQMHTINLASLNGEFATVVNSDDILRALRGPVPA